MKYMTGYEIRKMWLDFFASQGHEVMPSASLIPVDDPTLLWINAGVAPLKKYFDGREKPKSLRMVNAQKSIRTNDIEIVGKTARHHTFFEMLGNFSVGDYFRKEALEMAVELLFEEKWFGFDKNLIYITYYYEDYDTFNYWQKLGIDKSHLIPLKENFWEIGEGPCGPDTEIFYDRGIKYDPQNIGIKLIEDDIENDRYIEIWNIVLSQFNSKAGQKRSEYAELPSKNIDTGGGLERLTCIMQEVETNYDTDLFKPYIEFLENYTNIKYNNQMAFRVIVDHIRSVTFALSDGAIFSNEGRGYVLRRILRRAIRYGKKLNINEPFLYKMVPLVVEKMKDFYPYLTDKLSSLEVIVKTEEESFLKTLEKGEARLLDIIDSNKGQISGDDAFLLYDTFGFPIELTIEAAQERGVSVDINGFEKNLEQQKIRSRNSRNVTQSMNVQNADYLKFDKASKFIGYDLLKCRTTVTSIFKNGKSVNSSNGELIFTTLETPFYAESGGQIGDQGTVTINGEIYNVFNTFKLPNGQHAHVTDTENANMQIGDTIILEVDQNLRFLTACNHSATHLLNQALRDVLGSHVIQQGSQVNSTNLRFDFNHYVPLTNDEILKIEVLVNEAIKDDYKVKIIETSLEEAKKLGAQAVFGEKYGEVVRLVDMDYSKELCGGTHVVSTGQIQKFAILSVETKGSGIFRIEAATNNSISNAMLENIKNIEETLSNLKDKYNQLIESIKNEKFDIIIPELPKTDLIGSYVDVINKRQEQQSLLTIIKNLEKQYENSKMKKNMLDYKVFLNDIVEKDGVKILVKDVNSIAVNIVKEVIEKIANLNDKIFIFFAIKYEDKLLFIAKDKGANINCNNMVKFAATLTGGNGGGHPDYAQAGGKDISKLENALLLIRQELKI